MSIGALRKRVVIQQETANGDTGGGYAVGWTALTCVWAEITPVTGTEKWFSAQLEAALTHRIIIRYRSDVTAAMRVLYGLRVFNIRAVLNTDEANRWTELLVEEGVAL